MIYLIGGSPRGGKSILSRKLSKKLNIPYISTDNIRPIVMPYFKGEEKIKSFPFERMFDIKAIHKYFEDFTGKQILEADIKEAKTIWPGVKSLIDFLLVCEMDYIIEGVHLLPNLVKIFKNNENVKTVFLFKEDAEKIFKGLKANKGNNDWLMDNIKDEKTVRLAAESLCVYGRYFVKEAGKYGFEVVNTEEGFLKRLGEAVWYLVK